MWLPLVLLPSCIHGMVSTEASCMTHVDRGWVMDSRWGLGWGLLSGLLDTTSGMPEVPTGVGRSSKSWPSLPSGLASPLPCKNENNSR